RRWGAGKSVCGTVRKKGISGRCLPTRCETGPSRRRWKPRGPTPPKNLYREVVRPIQELESESQNGNPGLELLPQNSSQSLPNSTSWILEKCLLANQVSKCNDVFVEPRSWGRLRRARFSLGR